MFTEVVQVTFEKMMQTRSYTVIILATPEKRFAIYADSSTGKRLQMYFTGSTKPRPQTHDLLNMLLQGFSVRLKQVVISDLQDTVYFARIFLEQERGELRHIVEIDARPSDAITLALIAHVPIFCTTQVLQKTIALEE